MGVSRGQIKSIRKGCPGVHEACGRGGSFTIRIVPTDNGKSFTDRFTVGGERKPSEHHLFDQECQSHGIEHRLIKPGRPQMNGMVERFNGRISDVLATRCYDSSEDLEQTLER